MAAPKPTTRPKHKPCIIGLPDLSAVLPGLSKLEQQLAQQNFEDLAGISPQGPCTEGFTVNHQDVKQVSSKLRGLLMAAEKEAYKNGLFISIFPVACPQYRYEPHKLEVWKRWLAERQTKAEAQKARRRAGTTARQAANHPPRYTSHPTPPSPPNPATPHHSPPDPATNPSNTDTSVAHHQPHPPAPPPNTPVKKSKARSRLEDLSFAMTRTPLVEFLDVRKMLIEQVRRLQGLAISRSQAEDHAAFVKIVEQKEIKILDTLFPPKRPRNAVFLITHPAFLTTTWTNPLHNPGYDHGEAQDKHLQERTRRNIRRDRQAIAKMEANSANAPTRRSS
jgi:hypothetical protein